MNRCDVAIIGAGPYGLAVAAHLCRVRGLDVRVFGEPMSFWDRNMPLGMLLRSNWTATQIAGPDESVTLEAFQRATGQSFSMPVPLDCFIQYGLWYQKLAVPHLDRREVTRIDHNASGFRVELAAGEALEARRVIIAAGIGSFAWVPSEFKDLPSTLASHTSQQHDLSRFVGKQVLIIGGGQSALESAALIHEAQGAAEVFARTHEIHWLQGLLSKTLHHGLGSFVRRVLYAPTDVGPAGLSQLLARPHLVRRLPRGLQDRLRKRAVRPAGARWLVDRLKTVPIHLGRSVTSVQIVGEKVKVRFHDGTERLADHVLLGTGYKVDVSKYAFLSPKLVESISRHNGYPRLRGGLETSVSGLHIVGAPAAWSFGPVMQFVSGTTFACRELLRSIGSNHAV
jgi:cation diffusion facilitator CzcD-associated flavoprotein CzcO